MALQHAFEAPDRGNGAAKQRQIKAGYLDIELSKPECLKQILSKEIASLYTDSSPVSSWSHCGCKGGYARIDIRIVRLNMADWLAGGSLHHHELGKQSL